MYKKLYKIWIHRFLLGLIAFLLWSCAVPQSQEKQIVSPPANQTIIPAVDETIPRQPLPGQSGTFCLPDRI